MRETVDDLATLQSILDASHGSAGRHLADIHGAEVRLTAQELVQHMNGMRVVVVATVSSDARPFTGPVDAFLIRGRLIFGTAPDALRTRHLGTNPSISATYVEGEGLVMTIHGSAVPVDATEDPDVRDVLVAQYGDSWHEWASGAPYFAIDPTRWFASDINRRTVDGIST